MGVAPDLQMDFLRIIHSKVFLSFVKIGMKLFALCFGGQHYVISILLQRSALCFVFSGRVCNPSISC
jgi:hypothetical protein